MSRRGRKFCSVIDKAKEACDQSGQQVVDHFVDLDKMVFIGSQAQRPIRDVRLSRYACYLIIQNADPSKELVALGQTHFAVQTCRQELMETEAYQICRVVTGSQREGVKDQEEV